MRMQDIKEGGVYRVVHRDDKNAFCSHGSIVKVTDVGWRIPQVYYVELVIGSILDHVSPEATLWVYPSELEEVE